MHLGGFGVTRALVIMGCCLIAACAASEDAQLMPASELMVDGVAREYRVFVPTTLPDGSMPLLVAVHGGGGRDYAFPQQRRFEELADEEGVIIVYPLSHQLPHNEGEWQLNTDAQSRQDVDFVEALIDDLSARYPVDPARVYAVGYSLGSMFTYELACHASSRFAAIASHAGTMPVSPSSCALEDPIAVMHLHGVEDFIIAYGKTWDWKAWDAVGTMMDIPSLVQFWSDQDHCQNESQTESAASRHIVHDACDQDVRVEHHRLDTVGHEWPDSIGGVSTHQVIWSFLSGFSKR
jgi:polyhydroxybutyrate depolymerase